MKLNLWQRKKDDKENVENSKRPYAYTKASITNRLAEGPMAPQIRECKVLTEKAQTRMESLEQRMLQLEMKQVLGTMDSDDEDRGEYTVQLSKLMAATPNTKTHGLKEVIIQAKAAHHYKNYPKAIELYNAAKQLYPERARHFDKLVAELKQKLQEEERLPSDQESPSSPSEAEESFEVPKFELPSDDEADQPDVVVSNVKGSKTMATNEDSDDDEEDSDEEEESSDGNVKKKAKPTPVSDDEDDEDDEEDESQEKSITEVLLYLINQGTPEELQQLQGIGTKRARDIVEHRTSTGRFRSLDDLMEISGIGKAFVKGLTSKNDGCWIVENTRKRLKGKM
eukprot:TRINITY_DN9455_c0_g1_i2.p1 TRINITY_DN9455_c0_g1~~TRINITY_DN9455_c0_g1_i2.p1  ORF type:complete len:339 (-),score=121.68 TRINITY_DN9455_c0_g1_i2:9-1025(-)